MRQINARRPPRPVPAKTWTTTVTGALASILVHGLLFMPMMWGGHHARARAPDEPGAAASRQAEKSTDSMLVVFQEDSLAIHDASSIEQPELTFPQPFILPIARPRLPLPEASSLDEDDDAQVSEADGDQGGHSMMFGRYMGQISARVERAWVRPRSVPPSGSFACRVQITQDRRGAVQEVALERCTEDPRWQMSLVQAIQTASPLPAPPDPAVFSNLVTLEFDSDPYVAGSEVQGGGVEPPSRPNK